MKLRVVCTLVLTLSIPSSVLTASPYGPTLVPYTAYAEANWLGDTGINTGASISHFIPPSTGMGMESMASADVMVEESSAETIVTITLSGEGGEELWENPEFPEEPPMPMPIPAMALGSLDGLVSFPQVAPGTPMELAVSAITTGFYSVWNSWQCTLFRGTQEIAFLHKDGSYLEVVQVFADEPDLRILVEVSSDSGGLGDPFDGSLTLTLTGIPEPCTFALLGLGGIPLLRRRS